MTGENKTEVNGLWIGERLSSMEMLTISSFIRNGYQFNLWLYDRLVHPLPEGCVVKDASTIIPAEKIFKYKNVSQFGTGKGSVSGFSDIFRYKLLHDVGGWWVDMDVTSIKPFIYDEPYFFRHHHSMPLVGNIMKAPKGSSLMWNCYEEASATVDENNQDWHKPIEILARNVFAKKLQQYIVSEVSNTDEWPKIERYVWKDSSFPDQWHFVHWCNEVWRTKGIQKDKAIYSSSYGRLLLSYALLKPLSPLNKFSHDMGIRLRRTWQIISQKLGN